MQFLDWHLFLEHGVRSKLTSLNKTIVGLVIKILLDDITPVYRTSRLNIDKLFTPQSSDNPICNPFPPVILL